MLAIGVGGADAVDAMTGTPWELKAPQIVGESDSMHELVAMLEFVLRRYTFDREFEWMGHAQRLNPSSSWEVDGPREWNMIFIERLNC